jgi:hypothetical protein
MSPYPSHRYDYVGSDRDAPPGLYNFTRAEFQQMRDFIDESVGTWEDDGVYTTEQLNAMLRNDLKVWKKLFKKSRPEQEFFLFKKSNFSSVLMDNFQCELC